MRKMMCLSVCLGLMACAGSGVDSSEAALSELDTSETSSYFLTNEDAMPVEAWRLSEAERLAALPVSLRVHDDFLVAWHAPEGVALVGDVNSALTAWPVHREAINGVVDELPTLPPLDSRGLSRDQFDDELKTPGVDLWETDVEVPTLEVPEEHEIGKVNWDEENLGDWLRYWEGHPGCLEI